MSSTDNDENPFAVTATKAEALEYAELRFGAGFWVCLLVAAAPLFALIPINFFLSIVGGQVVLFTVVRSVVYLLRARDFKTQTGRTPFARSGVALFVLSLIVSAFSSVASWIAFVAVCTPLSFVGLTLFNASKTPNPLATYLFFGLWIFAACLALFLQWILIRMTIPTTFEVMPTYASAKPSSPAAPPVLAKLGDALPVTDALPDETKQNDLLE